MIAHKWQLISPLSDCCDYDFAEIDTLQRQWTVYRQAREAAQPDAYSGFLERLTRSWAIETGIIEGLYTLDRGMTETLVMHGISANLIEESATNKAPQELARILTDHQDTVSYIYRNVREERPVSSFTIKEIHILITRNQPTYRAVNQFDQWFDAQLRHGEFKTQPNNPTRPDGEIHEYCPPEQVASEVDRLVEWYTAYSRDIGCYHPLLTATWLHHRFTQIHPFQDGNGRVVRALLTWHLAREEYLPVVVKRDDRADYIDALEKADGGDLVPFIDLIVRLQKRSILEALGEPEIAEPIDVVDQVLDHIVEEIGRKDAEHETLMRSVNASAESLRDSAGELLQERADQAVKRLDQAGRTITSDVLKGGPGAREYWYRWQVEQTARNSGHWVNLNESRFYVRLILTPDGSSRRPRLIFVVSLHHTGRQLSGIMAATAFALIDHYPDGPLELSEESGRTSFTDCTPVEPFTFTWEDNPETLFPRFTERVERSLAIALRQWGEYLT